MIFVHNLFVGLRPNENRPNKVFFTQIEGIVPVANSVREAGVRQGHMIWLPMLC